MVIKIGADCVISLVHDYLEKRADTSTTLELTFVGELSLCWLCQVFILNIAKCHIHNRAG